MPLPRIPDVAFQTATDRHAAWLKVSRTESSRGARREAAHNFARSLGLDQVDDPRAYDLVRAMLAHLSRTDPTRIATDHVNAGMTGLTLGLLLAQATGWEPPIE